MLFRLPSRSGRACVVLRASFRRPSDTRLTRLGDEPGHGRRAAMRSAMRNRFTRTAAGLALAVATIGLAACGDEGSSGTEKADTASGAGCAPLAGDKLVVLDDDKKLQTADNIIAVVYG